MILMTNNKYSIFSLLLVVLLVAEISCNAPKKGVLLELTSYSNWTIDPNKGYETVTLLHAYPAANIACPKCADLYVCQDSTGRDSIFVLDINPNSSNKYFLDRDRENQGFTLNLDDVKHFPYKQVNVTVPENFIVPKKIKFIFGNLSRALD